MLELLQRGDKITYKRDLFGTVIDQEAVVISNKCAVHLGMFPNVFIIKGIEPNMIKIERFNDSMDLFDLIWIKDEENFKKILGDVEI